MTACPDCAADIPVPQDSMKGEVVACPDCGESFEIVNISPVLLKKAESVGEDWGQ